MKKQLMEAKKKLLSQSQERALMALRCAIKECARCAPADAILCTDCEARYLAQFRSAGLRPETQN